MEGPRGDVTGGREVGTSCSRVSSYFAFSMAYLYGKINILSYGFVTGTYGWVCTWSQTDREKPVLMLLLTAT